MTICIAALADDGKKVVLVADQMTTANIPISYEFETEDVQKIFKITDKAYVLTAGNAIFAYEIVMEATKKILANQVNTIENIAEIIREEFVTFRNKIISRNVLEPRGMNLQTYYQMQQRLVLPVVQEIESNLVNHNIGVDLIVAGQNDDESCHIYTITHPGQLLNHDTIGHVAVGSGAPHATYYLIGSIYKKNLTMTEVKRLAEEAKKKSEVAPGVGQATTIVTIPSRVNGGER